MTGIAVTMLCLALALVPIVVRASVDAELVPHLHARARISVCGVTVATVSIRLRRTDLLLTAPGGKTTVVRLVAPGGDENSLASHLDNGIAAVADLRRIELATEIGVVGDAAVGAIASASAEALLDAALAALAARYDAFTCKRVTRTVFDGDVCRIRCELYAAFSAATLVCGFLLAVARHARAARRDHGTNHRRGSASDRAHHEHGADAAQGSR